MPPGDRYHLRVSPVSWIVAGILVPLVSGCDQKRAMTLQDTEHRTFTAACSEEGECQIELASGPAWPSGAALFRLESPGRLISVCTLEKQDQTTIGSECRALECSKNSDCPPIYGMKYGSCISGLCGDASHEVLARDAVLLCLSGAGVGESSKEQLDRFAMAVNCGTPCKVPNVCRPLPSQ
jgi:hypothetical protein